MNRYIVLGGLIFLMIAGCNQENNSSNLRKSVEQGIDLKNLKKEDISSVTIISQGLNKTLVLQGYAYKEFIEEFMEIAKRNPHIPTKEEQDEFRQLTIKPDFLIMITFSNGKNKEFEVLGRGLLRDCDTGWRYQFYMGLYILEWLKDGHDGSDR